MTSPPRSLARATIEAWAFGIWPSQARGEADDASDIDIAVVFDAAAPAEGLADFGGRQRVEDWLCEILAAKADLFHVAMQRSLVRASYEADRIYAFQVPVRRSLDYLNRSSHAARVSLEALGDDRP